MASALVVMEASPKYAATQSKIKPTPSVAAFVVTDIRRYKSGMRRIPTAASKDEYRPERRQKYDDVIDHFRFFFSM